MKGEHVARDVLPPNSAIRRNSQNIRQQKGVQHECKENLDARR